MAALHPKLKFFFRSAISANLYSLLPSFSSLSTRGRTSANSPLPFTTTASNNFENSKSFLSLLLSLWRIDFFDETAYFEAPLFGTTSGPLEEIYKLNMPCVGAFFSQWTHFGFLRLPVFFFPLGAPQRVEALYTFLGRAFFFFCVTGCSYGSLFFRSRQPAKHSPPSLWFLGQ